MTVSLSSSRDTELAFVRRCLKIWSMASPAAIFSTGSEAGPEAAPRGGPGSANSEGTTGLAETTGSLSVALEERVEAKGSEAAGFTEGALEDEDEKEAGEVPGSCCF